MPGLDEEKRAAARYLEKFGDITDLLAMHASAPAELLCSDCIMNNAACDDCKEAYLRNARFRRG